MNTPILGLDDFEFDQPKKISKEKNIIGAIRKALVIIIVIILSAGGTYFYIEYNSASDNPSTNESRAVEQEGQSIEPEEVLGLNSCSNPEASVLGNISAWWDESYKYSNRLNVDYNNSIDKNKYVTVTFNHKSLVDSSKSSSNGDDLRLVLEVEGNFMQIPFQIENVNSQNTKLKFRLNRDYEEASYKMYYGNPSSQNKSQNISGSENKESSYAITLSEEMSFPIVANTNQKWALKGYDTQPLELNIDIDDSLNNIENLAVNFEIEKTDVTGAIIAENGKYVTTVNVDNLEAGTYVIRGSLSDNCYTIKSQPVEINVSYPIFVVWTMDWEGQNVNRNYLNQITEISDQYDIPLTQLFNPRIYITNSITQQNKDLMHNWIKDREAKGDEIGLHLHMWYDMIREIGLTPKRTPSWASMNTGYDVFFTSYNEQESDRIVKWGLAKMKEKGFEDIKTFRAGGWEIDIENMRALEKNGIKIDTSGRTNHKMGVNLVTSGWTLPPNQKPYQPSKSNINKTSADHFNLWEFPNNGAESYLYSYEQMKERFDLNYQENNMKSPQVITYLSHPHWFNIDYPKLRQLFGYIDQYNFEDDRGPVVYSTLEESYEYWINVVE